MIKFDELYRLDDPKGREEFLVQLVTSNVPNRERDTVRNGLEQIDDMIAAWKRNFDTVMDEANIEDFFHIVCDGMSAGIESIFRTNFTLSNSARVVWTLDDESGAWGFMLKRKPS